MNYKEVGLLAEINILNIYVNKVPEKKIKDDDPEVISWQRVNIGGVESPLMYIYPQSGETIKDKKFFAVKDYERALFYDKGSLIGELKGGIYELDKKARVKGTEIVWIDTSLNEIPWGIPKKHGIPTQDGIMIGLFGDLKLKVSNIKTFYTDVVAGKKEWKVRDLKEWIMSLLHTSLRDIFKHYNMKQVILEDRERVINLITSKITEEFLRYGLNLETFNIIGIKAPEDLQEVLDLEKDKMRTLSQVSRGKLDDLIQQKEDLQVRLKELKDKKRELQDKLLGDEITTEEYGKKKKQIELFIEECETELKKVEETIPK